MSEDILEKIIQQVFEQSGNYVSITWQGGEPTLLGLDFFQKVIEIETKYGKGQQVANSIQTNGTLLNVQWVEFVKKYKFLVGLSIDGPKHVHDYYRKYKSNQGSWDKVSQNAKMLLNAGVEVNSLTCVTDYSSRFPEEIYNYLTNLGFTFLQFIPVVELDKNNPSQSASYSVNGIQYGKFLSDIFDLWWADYKKGRTIFVRHIDSIFHRFVGLESPECPLKSECGNYLTIEHNGDVYSCDFFVSPEWKLGNIKEGRLIEMLNSEKMQEFGKLKSDYPKRCTNCKWIKYCYGGCTKDRINDRRDIGENHFCASYKSFLEHAAPVLNQLAEDWRKKNPIKGFTYDASGYF
jgi:uncharacterized protein